LTFTFNIELYLNEFYYEGPNNHSFTSLNPKTNMENKYTMKTV